MWWTWMRRASKLGNHRRSQRTNSICKLHGTRRSRRTTPIGMSGGQGGGMAPFSQQTPACNAAPMYSNITKRYVNWKVCILCGFDVEDGHTSKMCPAQRRQANHQERFNQANSNQNIATGYNACTKAMHKSHLPS